MNLAGNPVDDVNRLPGIIDNQFLTCPMALPHHDIQGCQPPTIQIGELAILITALVAAFAVFLP